MYAGRRMDVEYEGRGEFALSCDDKLASLGAAQEKVGNKKRRTHWFRHGNHDSFVAIGIRFCPNCEPSWAIALEFAELRCPSQTKLHGKL
jgi:hypothetical protein